MRVPLSTTTAFTALLVFSTCTACTSSATESTAPQSAGAQTTVQPVAGSGPATTAPAAHVTLPATCADLITADMLSVWKPSGRSTPLLNEARTEQQGTHPSMLTCDYGQAGGATFNVTAQLLSPSTSTRATVQANLESQGLKPTEITEGALFSDNESAGGATAQAHLVNDQMWLSILVHGTDSARGVDDIALVTPWLVTMADELQR